MTILEEKVKTVYNSKEKEYYGFCGSHSHIYPASDKLCNPLSALESIELGNQENSVNKEENNKSHGGNYTRYGQNGVNIVKGILKYYGYWYSSKNKR